MRAAADSRPATVRAFDRMAADYDRIAAGDLFVRLRARTHRAYVRRIASGARVLEIGCGTGIDTAFLASRGAWVVACDPSEEMVSRTLRRLAREHLDARAVVMPCGLDDLPAYLDALAEPGGFDAIVSNFGALNCVEHLAPLGVLVRRHLRPGGIVLVSVMTRLCLFELCYFIATGRPARALRRMGSPVVCVPVAGIEVPTFYHTVGDLRRCVGREARLVTVEGIGVALPPPYFEPRWARLPVFSRRAAVLVDRALARWAPFNRLGDHVLLHFVKEPAHG